MQNYVVYFAYCCFAHFRLFKDFGQCEDMDGKMRGLKTGSIQSVRCVICVCDIQKLPVIHHLPACVFVCVCVYICVSWCEVHQWKSSIKYLFPV